MKKELIQIAKEAQNTKMDFSHGLDEDANVVPEKELFPKPKKRH